ncbi:phosphoribosylanthranilate isomerase [Campylobacter sp. 19-13652]|uniref:phosphoribosylanthranilate isomerase n=1 Tax=Campylobacter sp. 19-13652 TaxID=2840180 RepID=UPI001C756442|nr:phosphoribosylanthranilate isomerase [Campylobacter sp. 19-13652]BCX78658.1 N-(5'-phosphoribosyl)anthranilate isomerase [Campylobacter sp. 19-13652]
MRLKICGIKSVAEAKTVLGFNEVDYVGLILASSKRRVSPELATQIASLAHEMGKQAVGVFVDAAPNEILASCQSVGFDVVQLHIKQASSELYAGLRAKLNQKGVSLWQALSVRESLPEPSIDADMVLYDASGKFAGGNGVSFSWDLLRTLKAQSFGLAGGIGADNIAKAASYRPALIDLNSKLEDENGIKSSEKISRTLINLKEAV